MSDKLSVGTATW